MLIMPVIVLFYQENGLTMFDVFLLQGIYSVAIVLLEIPSGYLADIWGRKNTIIIGSILGALGFVVYSQTSGFWWFLIAEMILGIGQSFISGSDSALLYDTLLEQKREKEYMKLEGRVLSIGNFAETIAAILGGVLAEISLRTPFTVQIFIAMLAIPASIMLIEPKRKKIEGKNSFKNILQIVKLSLVTDKKLKWTIVFSSVIGVSTLTMAWFVQPLLKELNFTVFEIGIMWALLNLTVGLTTLVAHKIEGKLDKKNTVILISLVVSLSYLLIGYIYSVWIIAVLFLFYFIRGIATPVLKDYINRITSSDVRATVLSVRNFVIRVLFSIVGPFLGWFSDKFSIQQAFIISGAIFLILSVFSAVMFIKRSK